MNSHEILSIYENVAVITDQMLEAARNGDWEQLIALESDCASQVEILKNEDTPAPLPPVARERKVTIIKKILADDRAIRTITEPWMAELSLLMNSGGTRRKLSQAYDANQSG
jgi:flagellar protein FliT